MVPKPTEQKWKLSVLKIFSSESSDESLDCIFYECILLKTLKQTQWKTSSDILSLCKIVFILPS